MSALPAPTGSLPVPDRLTVWPVEGGRFGLDATFQGASGYERAGIHERSLVAAGAPYSFRQELGDGWTLRLGPFPAEQARRAMDAFLGVD